MYRKFLRVITTLFGGPLVPDEDNKNASEFSSSINSG